LAAGGSIFHCFVAERRSAQSWQIFRVDDLKWTCLLCGYWTAHEWREVIHANIFLYGEAGFEERGRCQQLELGLLLCGGQRLRYYRICSMLSHRSGSRRGFEVYWCSLKIGAKLLAETQRRRLCRHYRVWSFYDFHSR
jgi:hypothetical protein